MKKILILVIIMALITGCEKDNRKCVESHQENGRCVLITTVYNGKTFIPVTHYYECIKVVCDKYEEVNSK